MGHCPGRCPAASTDLPQWTLTFYVLRFPQSSLCLLCVLCVAVSIVPRQSGGRLDFDSGQRVVQTGDGAGAAEGDEDVEERGRGGLAGRGDAHGHEEGAALPAAAG